MEQDKELKAMSDIMTALTDLEDAARARVMKYVLERVGAVGGTMPVVLAPTGVEPLPVQDGNPTEGAIDIRTLKEQKNPKTAIQMAVLVGYYLREKVPVAERKETFGAADIQKYFIQAGFELPAGKNGALDTLNNAKKSGYVESVGSGGYRLNAVGYNLVAFRLGAGKTAHGKKKSSRKKKIAKKGRGRR